MSIILFIDDDIRLAALLGTHLEQEGFSVHIETQVSRGVNEAVSGNYAIVVLDMVRAQPSSMDALRRIRASSELPVLVLTASREDADRMTRLELGADAHVAKPYAPKKFSAKIRAILRREQATKDHDRAPRVLVCGGLTLWPEQRRVEWLGEPLRLTSAELSLLEVLLRHAGRPVSKHELCLRALGRRLAHNDRSVDVHLSRVRRKLGVLTDGRSLIHSVHKYGYRLLELTPNTQDISVPETS
jgi:two-component system, OmpR family, response regulator